MVVINPNDTTHFLRIIPRVYNANANTFDLYDEDLRTTTTVSNTKTLSKGYAIYDIDLTTTEGKSYSYKISEGSTVVARGRIFVTAQTTQQYRINE